MPKYVIEREIPGIGSMSSEELASAARKSCDAIETLYPRLQWLESFVTADKVFCIYIAESEEAIMSHADRSGFPAHRISEVEAVLDPSAASV
jgi:hypothetical protein